MSQASSVLLDSAVATSDGAHDTLHNEATPAIHASLNLESTSQHTLQQLTSKFASPPLQQQHPSHDTIENGVLPVCVTTSSSAHDPSLNRDHDQVVPPSPRDTTNPLIDSRTNPTSTATAQFDSQYAVQADSHKSQVNGTFTSTQSGDAATTETHEDRMIFGHQKPANVLQRRRNYANTNAVTDYEADLTSKDRAKQKEAVKKFLMDRVRQDWAWEWPRLHPRSDESSPEREPEQLDEVILQGQWKERDEWLSNASESEGEPTIPATTSSPDTPSPTSKSSPFRFESPDGVGMTIKKTQLERKRRRKKRLMEEAIWNDGLRCFVARRDAWTGARRVSRSTLGFVGAKGAQVVSTSSEDGSSSTAMEHDEDQEWEDEIEIPVAPSLIPPENAMRASILPAAYSTIYDKVVVQALTPSCPMNLKDITRSCVQGWKRDGEWPPKSSVPEPKKKGRKMSIASLFGVEKHEKEVKEVVKTSEKEKESEKKGGAATGIRKGLQKILSLGHSTKEQVHTNGNEHVGKGKAADVTHIS